MKYVVPALLVLLLSGCTSLPEPDGTTTLVVGAIEQVGTGYPSDNGARLNGTHKSGIVLTFENRDTGRKYDLTSYQGIFRSTKLPEGLYRLVNLHLEVRDSSGSNSAGMSLSSRPFLLQNNKVLNLGSLLLRMDYQRGLSWEQEPRFDPIQDDYRKLKTAWNDVEWENVSL